MSLVEVIDLVSSDEEDKGEEQAHQNGTHVTLPATAPAPAAAAAATATATKSDDSTICINVDADVSVLHGHRGNMKRKWDWDQWDIGGGTADTGIAYDNTFNAKKPKQASHDATSNSSNNNEISLNMNRNTNVNTIASTSSYPLSSSSSLPTSQLKNHGNTRQKGSIKTICSVEIYRQDGDNGIITDQLKSLLESFQASSLLPSNMNNTSTSKGGVHNPYAKSPFQHTAATSTTADASPTGVVTTYLPSQRKITNDNKIQTTSKGQNIALTSPASSPMFLPKGEVVHIQQKDQWSCGYRNLQMLLSAILPNVPSHHPIHGIIQSTTTNTTKANSATKSNDSDNQKTTIIIPSIKQLQYFIEQAWSEGFDSQGREFYSNKMRNKKGHEAKIGALEISSILSYLYVDVTVLQFITCYESRSLLGCFVWAYFNKLPILSRSASSSNGSDTCSCYYCNGEQISSSLDSSFQILQYVSSSNHNFCKDSNRYGIGHCSHPLLPLYLQWEGHSVSCIGVERIPRNETCTTSNNDNKSSSARKKDYRREQYNLIIFDPIKSGSTLKEELKATIAKNSNKIYPIGSGASAGVLSSLFKRKSVLRLSTKELLRKDCQIVVCSLKPLQDRIRQIRALETNSNVITAADEHVERSRLLQEKQKRRNRSYQ